jgi:hypothetical protein
MQKNRCTIIRPWYSYIMQANSIINDDFNTQIQSDEFATEYEAYLDEQEKNYWREIEAKGNGKTSAEQNEKIHWAMWWGYKIA